ncbi:MAG: hypothetical protein L0312_25630, partial [Acidobacteria bacterium]|nr:hypothetical protein [Acidobacteriota bacterium]
VSTNDTTQCFSAPVLSRRGGVCYGMNSQPDDDKLLIQYLLRTWQMRNQVDQAQVERAMLQQREKELQAQLEQQRASGSEAEKELKRVREELARLVQQQKLEDQRARLQPPSLPAELNIAHFDLSPQMRGIGQPADLSIPPGTDYVALRLELESDDHPGYRAELQAQNGQNVWRSGKLRAQTKGESKVIDVSISASLLKPQRYTLKVRGLSASGSAAVAYDYPFRVVK